MNYEQHLKHLIWLASMDKGYAWWRAQQMEADKSGLWVGIAEDLKREMLALKSSSEQKPIGG